MTKENLLSVLRDGFINARSTWNKAVWSDAFEMVSLSDVDEFNIDNYQEILLNGARSWHEYSWGGYSLVYDMDIAKHYCTPSELKKTRDGLRKPNSREDWLDVQARALHQACRKVGNAIYMNNRREAQ